MLKKTLAAQGIALVDFTAQIHGLKFNFPLFIRPGNALGIVMHNTSGLSSLSGLVDTWRAKEPNPPPSHLAIEQSGTVGQYIRLEFADRATEHTFMHLSIEFQAVENGDITTSQIKTAAIITAFAHVVFGVELAVANGRTAKGLAHHSLFVDKGNPDGHANCPGLTIVGRKEAILDQAKEFVGQMTFSDEPAGRWRVKVGQWMWIYTFDVNGNVSWLDPYNQKRGQGRWTIKGQTIVISWVNSTTKESWDLPLNPAAQTGSCVMDGEPYDLNAVKL
jgi:hypothetical protein